VSGRVPSVSLSVRLIEKPCFSVQTLWFHLKERIEVFTQDLHLNLAGTRARENVISTENVLTAPTPLDQILTLQWLLLQGLETPVVVAWDRAELSTNT